MPRSPREAIVAAALAAFALSGAGCTDLDHYTTGANESYCGVITLGGPFRTGLSPQVQMRLTLDAAELDGARSPGKIWTFESGRPERRLFNGSQLRRIAHLENDPLSRLEFGEGRDHNRLFAVSPADRDDDPMLAVVSLKSDNGVDVRLLRPGRPPKGDEDPPPGQRAIFGIFSLTRQAGTCGF